MQIKYGQLRAAIWMVALVSVPLFAGVAIGVDPRIGALFGLAAVVGVLWLHSPSKSGVLLTISGPILFSQIPVAGMTADNVVTAVGLLFLAVPVIVHWGRFQWNGLATYFLLLILAILLSVVANFGDAKSISLLRYCGLLFLVLYLSRASREFLKFSFNTLITCVSIGAVSIFAQPVTNWPAPYPSKEGLIGSMRYGGLFGHPNFAAYPLLLCALLVLLAPWMRPKLAFILSSTFTAAALMTGSRTALIVYAVLLLWMAFKLRNLAARYTVFGLVAMVAMVPIASIAVSRVLSLVETGGVSGDNAGGWRVQQWDLAISSWQSEPWFGIGWGHSEDILRSNLGVHNSYLEILVETGVVGATLFAIGVLALIKQALRNSSSIVLVFYVLGTAVFDSVAFYPSVLAILVVGMSVLATRPQSDESLSARSTTRVLPGSDAHPSGTAVRGERAISGRRGGHGSGVIRGDR